MFNLDDDQLKEFICNETASFALAIIDIEKAEVIYTNKAMNNILFDNNSTKCWEKLYGQKHICSWCQIKEIINQKNCSIENVALDYEYEYFNEVTNSWYQINNKLTTLEDGTNILVLIAIDISKQKKSQGELIAAQVKLIRQTQELEKAQEKLKLLASKDSLTNLYNRRYFIDTATLILNLAKRNGTQSTILMLDIDRFKSINDNYGHQVGDKVITTLAKLLQHNTRKNDVVCRWGGEEFIILLPNTQITGAIVLANKIKEEINNKPILITEENSEKSFYFTASIGLTQVVKEDKDSIEDAIKKADIALYEAKNTGRDKICIYDK